MLTPTLAAALAITPAIIAWWTGRAVLARADDPVLPELLFERRRRLMGFTLGGTVALMLLFTDETLWALPLLWLALLLSSYPLRRRLFGEQWNVLAFLRYNIFSAIGQIGLWLLAASATAVAISFTLDVAPDDHAAAVRVAAASGVVIATIVGLWQFHYARVFLALHRAVPLREVAGPDLVARLDGILDRAGASLKRRPAIYRYGAPGAYVMQALAIPSRSHPAVALGTTLLATLDHDEIAAVFAHEVAHHEQFQKSPMWRRARWTWLVVVVLLAVLPVLLVHALPAGAMAMSWCMPLILFTMLSRRVAKRRDAETASDLRAVELSGSADALISALTKLHVYSRVPRRWPHAAENAATHPSLARRIQALRAQSNAAPVPRTTSTFTALRSSRAGDVIGFDLERAYWFEGVPADTLLDLHTLRESASSYRVLAYGDLAELRVSVDGETRSLHATDRDGRSWAVPLVPNDVVAVQEALDRVDVKLGRRRVAPIAVNANATRWLAMALLIMLAAAGQLGLASIPILVVLIRPVMSAAVAAVAAIGAARVIADARRIPFADPVRQIALLIALIVAVILGVQAFRRARADATRGNAQRLTREISLVAGVLGAAALLFAVGLWPTFSGRVSSLFGHPFAIGIVTALAGIGGGLLTSPNRWWRMSGGLTSAAALAGVLILTGNGWLFNRIPSPVWSTKQLVATKDGALRIPGTASSIVASPSGGAFAVTQFLVSRRAAGGGVRSLIGRLDDSMKILRTSDATKVLFLDDETLLALSARDGDSLELRAERVAPDSGGNVIVLWRAPLPAMEDPRLLLDRSRGRWIVLSRGSGDWNFVVATDSVGGTHPQTMEIGKPATPNDIGEMMTQPLVAFANGDVIWLTLPRVGQGSESVAPFLFAFGGGLRWELRSSDSAGEHVLADFEGFATCASELDAGGAICVDHSPTGSHLWQLSSARGLRRLANLSPTYDIVHADANGRVTLAERSGGGLAIIDGSTLRGTRLTGQNTARGRWLTDAVATGGHVLTLSVGRDGALLERFSIR